MEHSEYTIGGTAEIWMRHATLQNVYSEILLASRGAQDTEVTDVDMLKTDFNKIIFTDASLIVATPGE
jgi:hypothetical protein